MVKLQKMNRRLHLSKTKHSKFNESGQLAVFYLFSFVWGCSILTAVRSWWLSAARTPNVDSLPCVSAYQEDFATNPTFLWENYPHTRMV